MANLILSTEAENDLIDIWFYIAQDNVTNADNYIDKLHQAVALIAANTLLGVERPKLANNIRCFPVDNYMLYYFPIDNGVEIVRVLHASRDVIKQF